MPTAQEWCDFYRSVDKNADKTLDELRVRWNQMAPHYAHKNRRSGYLAQLTELLALAPGESILDMGCGPGVLSVPLAKKGHDVVAVDFSDGMLGELRQAVDEAGVGSLLHLSSCMAGELGRHSPGRRGDFVALSHNP